MLVCIMRLWHLLIVLTYCLAWQKVGLQCDIVAFAEHTHFLFGSADMFVCSVRL